MKTQSEIFTEAHRIARTLEGDYRACFSCALRYVYAENKKSNTKSNKMETYKTIKPLKEENKVVAFINQSNDIRCNVVVNNKMFGVTYYDEETKEERTSDFLFEHGRNNANAQKAISLMNEYIESNL